MALTVASAGRRITDRKVFQWAVAPALLLALGACTTAMETQGQVWRLTTLPPVQGQRFVIQTNESREAGLDDHRPIDPRKGGGVEFGQTVAALVRAQLAAKGMVEAPSVQGADLIVELDYGVRDHTSGYVTSGYPDEPGPLGYPVAYTSYFYMGISRASDGVRLFLGSARADSQTDDLPRFAPSLVTAMFTNFPGRSGEFTRFTIPAQPKSARR